MHSHTHTHIDENVLLRPHVDPIRQSPGPIMELSFSQAKEEETSGPQRSGPSPPPGGHRSLAWECGGR